MSDSPTQPFAFDRRARSRILIVDDTPANLDVLVGLLKDEFDLQAANRGTKALELCAAGGKIDLILLDVMLPEMDGFEVCRRLREMPAMVEVPIMFLTALGDVESKNRGFEIGGNDYLTKPFDGREVQARVRALLKAKAYTEGVREQFAGELRAARRIQMGMLPYEFSSIEQQYHIEIGAVLEPAREVGGDLYGIWPAGPARLVVFLGDVSGKGLPASMFMMRAISIARLLAREMAEPEKILGRINDELSADNPACMFLTLQCAVFEPASGRLAIASGGQCRPVLLRAGEPPCWGVKRLGAALGLEAGLEFERTDLTLRAGDVVVFYTDGVIEAANPQDDLYGSDRLIGDTGALRSETMPNLAAGLLRQVHAFADRAPQSDDIAIVALRMPGAPASETGARVTLELNATPAEVMRAVEALREFAQARQLDEKAIFGLTLALEECASNIVNHACQRDAQQTFRVVFERTEKSLQIELRDRGPAFDPVQAERAAAPNKDDAAQVGGWGLGLVRRNTDELSYAREGSENILRLILRVGPALAAEPSRDARDTRNGVPTSGSPTSDPKSPTNGSL